MYLFNQVYYAYGNQPIKAVNVTNFTGMYTLDNLRPYTEYHIYVTAVKLIETTDRPLEGKKSKILMERTLAGGVYNMKQLLYIKLFSE